MQCHALMQPTMTTTTTTAVVETGKAVLPVPAPPIIPPSSDDDHDNNDASSTTCSSKRSMNSHYGHKVGALQTISLVLNAGLMIYAHVGLSAVLLSSFDPDSLSSSSATAGVGNNVTTVTSDNDASCGAEDEAIWIDGGGSASLPSQAVYCLTQYDGGCLANATCTESCMREYAGYGADCASCFGPLPQCGLDAGCALPCVIDAEGIECATCLETCVGVFLGCTGLPEVVGTTNSTSGGLGEEDVVVAAANVQVLESCNDFDVDDIQTWHNVYNITFVDSVRDTWNNDAKLLAVFICFFSGFWPYAKNVLLLIVWYVPMSVEHQTLGLLWLSRLSKFTLVDVFAVIGMLVGVQIQTRIFALEAAIRAEPRFAILCFFLATVWEFVQIEVIKGMHERGVSEEKGAALGGGTGGRGRLLFPNLVAPAALLVITIGLYVAGSATELIYLSSTDFGGESTCVRSYNVVTLGNELISELNMAGSAAAGQTWFLYLVYVLLVLVFPILVHVLQIAFVVRRHRSGDARGTMKLATVLWYFSCLEVLVIGIFAVESKFSEFIGNVAGVGTEGFLDVRTGLGTGFYVLVAYSFVASFLHYSLGIRHVGSDASTEPPEPENADGKEGDP